jgi:hypothetical protein
VWDTRSLSFFQRRSVPLLRRSVPWRTWRITGLSLLEPQASLAHLLFHKPSTNTSRYWPMSSTLRFRSLHHLLPHLAIYPKHLMDITAFVHTHDWMSLFRPGR